MPSQVQSTNNKCNRKYLNFIYFSSGFLIFPYLGIISLLLECNYIYSVGWV